MKNYFFVFGLCCLLAFCFLPSVLFAQTGNLQVSFTAVDDMDYIPLDSITIRNLSQGGDTVLLFPDTVLQVDLISSTGNHFQAAESSLVLEQNSPNPFRQQTGFRMKLSSQEVVSLCVQSLSGKILLKCERLLEKGTHFFRFHSGKELVYFVSAHNRNGGSSIKMISLSSGKQTNCSLEYMGCNKSSGQISFPDNTEGFVVGAGDELLTVGHFDGLESAQILYADSSQDVSFQFALGIPCPGLPSFVYGNQEYSTLQVRSQCWMKESLNFETENSSCIYNNPNNCDTYGRMYLWEAAKDACPDGWHLPSDNEWKILEGVADSLYGILDTVWDYPGNWRGFDAGTNIKSLSGWYDNGNGTDLFGFEAKPGGYQLFNGNYGGATIEVGFWTSTENGADHAWERFLHFNKGGIHRHPFLKEWGLYVRCVRDGGE